MSIDNLTAVLHGVEEIRLVRYPAYLRTFVSS